MRFLTSNLIDKTQNISNLITRYEQTAQLVRNLSGLRPVVPRYLATNVIVLRTDCVARNLYDQSILVDQPAQVTAARELWLAQGGRLPIPFCGSLAKTLLPGGTTQNPYAQTHSGIRAQRAHEHH